MMHERTHCLDEAANLQLPLFYLRFTHCIVPKAFRIIQIGSTRGYSSITQNLMQIHQSTCSVTLNVMATEYTCSLKDIYHPQWLVQWSLHCSHMCIPVHSPWLPGHIDVVQTVLIILTMAGLFLDRPHIFTWKLTHNYLVVDNYILFYLSFNKWKESADANRSCGLRRNVCMSCLSFRCDIYFSFNTAQRRAVF